MLDVHVLTLPGLPEEWIQQRRKSLDAAVAAAGYPVYVHEVEGIDGHLGKSRRKGYAEGSQPYVTHVDHDDWVREDAFAVLLPHLETGVRAITTGEVQIFPNGREDVLPSARHHLAVYEREWLWRQQFDRFKYFPDQFLIDHPESVHIEECVYYHRVYSDSRSRNHRDENRVESSDEARSIKDKRLLVAEGMTLKMIEEAMDA